MNIHKRVLVSSPGVYSTAEFLFDNEQFLAAASENRGEKAYIIDPRTLEYKQLYEGEVGVMNIVQVPQKKQLLCITKFYPIFQSKETTICSLTPKDDNVLSTWDKEEIKILPFCHRIGVVTTAGTSYLLACTLCEDKDFQEDWSKPGALWIARIPEEPSGTWDFHKVFEGLTKNHGLFIEHGNQVYISSDSGVMRFDFTIYREGSLLIPILVSNAPTSDIYIHEDKERRLIAAIEPFHGDTLSLYQEANNQLELIDSYNISFGHIVWIGTLFEELVLIVGNRGSEKNLEIIHISDGRRELIDSGVGSTQMSVYNEQNVVKILSANHNSGEVCLYTIEES
jgi:hypothetical protein